MKKLFCYKIYLMINNSKPSLNLNKTQLRFFKNNNKATFINFTECIRYLYSNLLLN